MKVLGSLLAVVLAASVSQAATTDDDDSRLDWVRLLPLEPFTDHFAWNSFCVMRTEHKALPETQVYKDLETGETRAKDAQSRRTTHDNIFVDSRFNATTCTGSADRFAWVQRIRDEEAWRQLIRGRVDQLLGADDNADDSAGSLWLLEIESAASAKGAVRGLPRDAHFHRRANSSTLFAMAYLSVADARRFAAAWEPTVIFPAPDVLKLSPSAYILTNPEVVADLVAAAAASTTTTTTSSAAAASDGARASFDDEVEFLAILHDPAPFSADSDAAVDADAAETAAAEARATELVKQCNTWLALHHVPGKASRAPYSRRIVLRVAEVRVQAIVVLLRETLLPHPDVLFVEARERFRLHNQYATAVTQNGTLADPTELSPDTRVLYRNGLSGAGQVVGVGDSGLDMRSCFFYEAGLALPEDNANNLYPTAAKVVQYVSFADNVEGDFGGHGTHVAGTVAGFGGASSTVTQGTSDEMDSYRGVAFNAKIAFFDMGNPGSGGLAVPGDVYNNFLGVAYDAGARIHTNSWGSETNSYTTTSRDFDRYSYDHQDFLVLVAAGNSGDAGIRTLGSPATGINVLAVGASMTSAHGMADSAAGPYCGSVSSCTSYFEDMADNLASFSSLGPSFDGRMKPDVVAPGFYISSAYSHPSARTCAVEAKAGTSMATPVTAGSAALVREYFVGKGIVPMGALVRAVLIHSATPMADPDWNRGLGNNNVELDGDVDTNQGFGLVGLQNALSFEDSPFELKYYGACSGACEQADFADMDTVVADGGVYEHVFKVSGTTGGASDSDLVPLSATLVWHGPAASSFTSGSVLVNDLDLTVVAPDGTVFLPLKPGGGTGVNTLDNAEKVVVPLASMQWGGEYTVRITGTNVAVGALQPFALVVTASLAPAEVGGIVDDVVADLTQSGDLSAADVQASAAGPAAGLIIAAFAIFIALVVVLVLLQVQGKWAAVAVTPAFLFAGAAARVGELAFAAAALALVVRDTRVIIHAPTPALSFDACGGAGPYLVAAASIAIIGAIVTVALLLKYMLTAPLGLLRAVAVGDAVVVLLLVAAIVVAADASCGAYALYYIPGAILCAALLLQAVALLLVFAQLAGRDPALGGGGEDGEKKEEKADNKKQQKDDKKKPAKDQTVPAEAAAPAAGAGAEVAVTVEKQGEAEAGPPLPAATAEAEAEAEAEKEDEEEGGEKKTTVKALYDYTAANPDELSFVEHDDIEISAVVDEGWATGVCKRTKQSGLFPRNYCTAF
jgi:hypothetical protein